MTWTDTIESYLRTCTPVTATQYRRALLVLHQSPTMSIGERQKQGNIPWWIAGLSSAELCGWLEVDETGSPVAVSLWRR